MMIATGQTPPKHLKDLVGKIAPRPLLLIADPESDNGEKLTRLYYKHAKQPKALWEIPGAGHVNGAVSRKAEYEKRIVALLQRGPLTTNARGTDRAAGARSSWFLDGGDVDGVRALGAVLGLEGHLRALGEGAEAAALMPVWWTNRSLPPSSGVMKPKPFSSLNHFTVPVAMWSFLHGYVCCERGGANEATCGRWHYVAGSL